ncbi:Hypothetical protein A7982_00004 [Minicystis rosea]|nr:Hypothetical protein A7982_00004 [Minicystis rosea]
MASRAAAEGGPHAPCCARTIASSSSMRSSLQPRVTIVERDARRISMQAGERARRWNDIHRRSRR